MAIRSETQRVLLRSFIASISLCGLVGIYCLLLGTWGHFEARVLGTTAVVAAASILGLCSAIPWERRIWHPVGPTGCVVTGLALALGLVAIWGEFRSDEFYKTVGVASVFAVAVPHVGLLSLARLPREHDWVRVVTVFVIATLSAQITIAIVFEPSGDAWVRFIGITSILTVCGTIAIPILHRIAALPPDGDAEPIASHVCVTCPRCGLTQDLAIGPSCCADCRLGFRIEIDAG